MTRRFTLAERRARIGARHRLAGGALAASAEEVAGSLVAVHSTDAASVVLALWARLADRAAAASAVEDALYERRSLLRLMGMRRTMFVVDREVAPLVHAGCGVLVEARERAKAIRMLREAGVGGRQPEAWLAGVEDLALAVLREQGECTATELAAADPLLATEVNTGQGKWSATQKIASRVLLLLALRGLAIRARPRGGWTSTQFRWAAFDAWAGGPLEALDGDAARAALARRWLHAFGPAQPSDLQWWAGWTAGQTKKALAGDDVAAVEIEEPDGSIVAGVHLASDLDPVAAPADPWVALLPALDSTPMGWKHRAFYLGPHADHLFDANGNVAPTIWADGAVVGGWTRLPDGTIATHLLEDPGKSIKNAIATEAMALAPRLGDATLAPRARGYSPLERGLLKS
jgi:hypothetical protein